MTLELPWLGSLFARDTETWATKGLFKHDKGISHVLKIKLWQKIRYKWKTEGLQICLCRREEKEAACSTHRALRSWGTSIKAWPSDPQIQMRPSQQSLTAAAWQQCNAETPGSGDTDSERWRHSSKQNSAYAQSKEAESSLSPPVKWQPTLRRGSERLSKHIRRFCSKLPFLHSKGQWNSSAQEGGKLTSSIEQENILYYVFYYVHLKWVPFHNGASASDGPLNHAPQKARSVCE